MVFPGRFSTGCLRCRQRKVKCDEGKPTCRRCAIYGKPCTGYTDQFHFRHTRAKSNAGTVTLAIVPAPEKAVDETKQPIKASAWQIPSRPGATRANGQQQVQQGQPRRLSQGQPLWHLNTPLVRSPEACYDDVSIYYFVRRFVSPNPVDGFPGHLSFLPSLYDSYSHGLLETATLSVAQMAAYNKFGGEKFKVESYKNYGRAIRLMQTIIKTEDQATDDKVIASILLLCTLKDISGEETGHPNEHAPGLFYLIEKRGPEQIATSRGAELLFLALIRLQVHSFLHEDSTYGDPGDIASIWGAFDPLLRAMSLMSKTLSCRHRLISDLEQEQNHSNQHSQKQDDQHQERASTVQGCFEILDYFHTWDNEAADYWKSTFEGRGIPTALGQIASGSTHYDVETACTLILIRTARLILLISMIAYHYQMGHHLKTPQAPLNLKSEQPHYQDIYSKGAALAALATCIPIIESDVRKTIDDMLASVPYALGEIYIATGLPHTTGSSIPHDGAAAIIMVHSIRLVASCAYATAEQTRQAMALLARFNSGIGIRAARGMDEEAAGGMGGLSLRSTRWAREQVFLRDVARVGGVGVGLLESEMRMARGETQAQYDELSPASESSMSDRRSSSFGGEFGGVSPIIAGSEIVYSPTTMLDSSSPCVEVFDRQFQDVGFGVGSGLPLRLVPVPDYGPYTHTDGFT